MANYGKYYIAVRLLLLKQYLEANAGRTRIVKRRELEQLLVDSVQSSKFITREQAREITAKLKKFAGKDKVKPCTKSSGSVQGLFFEMFRYGHQPFQGRLLESKDIPQDKVYRELKNLGAEYMQFIPCLDPIEESRGGMPFSFTPKAYGQFLCRLFDDYIHILLGCAEGTTCSTCGRCGVYYVVEGDGSVYPCDFLVLDQWKMGRLGENTLAEMAQSQQAKEFLQWGTEKPAECASCRWSRLCIIARAELQARQGYYHSR